MVILPNIWERNNASANEIQNYKEKVSAFYDFSKM